MLIESTLLLHEASLYSTALGLKMLQTEATKLTGILWRS